MIEIRRRSFRLLSSFSATAVLALAGCGSSDGGTTTEDDTGASSDTATIGDGPREDTRTPPESGSDGAPDAAIDTATDAATDTAIAPEGGVDAATDAGEAGLDASDAVADATGDATGDASAPFGTKIATGDYDVFGVTSDGYVIVFENTTGALQAIPIAGGTAVTIDAASQSAAVEGKVVFSWHGLDAKNIGALTAWTAAGGAKALSTTSLANISSVSADGTLIAYTDAATDAGPTNLVQSALDGTGKKTLTAADNSGCRVGVLSAGAYFLSAYCATSAATATIASFDAAGTKATLLSSALQFQSFDAAATKVLVISSTGAGSIVPIGGGTAVPIDTGMSWGAVRRDGTGVMYRSGATLKKAAMDGTGVTTLVSSGVGGFGAMSPDSNWTLFVGSADATTRLTDLFLASAVTPGAATTLNAAHTSSLASFGNVFTLDSSHVLYVTDVDTTAYTGTLKTVASSGGTPRTLATDLWLAFATTGAKIVFNDGYVSSGGSGPDRASLRAVDTATTAAPTLLQANADVDFALTAAHDKVVYTYSLVPAAMGLYVGALP